MICDEESLFIQFYSGLTTDAWIPFTIGMIWRKSARCHVFFPQRWGEVGFRLSEIQGLHSGDHAVLGPRFQKKSSKACGPARNHLASLIIGIHVCRCIYHCIAHHSLLLSLSLPLHRNDLTYNRLDFNMIESPNFNCKCGIGCSIPSGNQLHGSLENPP